LLRIIHDKLKPDGRLIIHHFREYGSRVKEFLRETGFSHKTRPATKEEIESSTALKENVEKSGNKGDRQIMHTEAWKKSR
jgi:hypothetical protein